MFVIKELYNRPLYDGTQYMFRFSNGYGASVVKHSSSYGGRDGEWELGVIQFHGAGHDEWRLVYHTSIKEELRNYFRGYLNVQKVNAILLEIQKLPS